MRSRSVTSDKVLRGDNPLPGTAFHYWLADKADAVEVTLTVTDVVTGECAATWRPPGWSHPTARRQGSITKAGNSRLRHLLVQAGVELPRSAATRRVLGRRQEGQLPGR